MQAAIDKQERFRVPETDKYDDDNVAIDQQPSTQKQLFNKRKLIAKKHNQQTFSNMRVGIHGQPLPQFFMKVQSDYCDQPVGPEQAQKVVDWWKQRPGSYVEKPSNTSQRNLQATQKFWAPKDAIYLADKSDSPAPVDAFKNVYSAKAKRDDNLMNWTKPTEKPAPDEEKSKAKIHEKTAKPRPQTASKFSAFENQFKKKGIDKGR